MLQPGKKEVLVISDAQCPFQHKDAWDFLEWIKTKRFTKEGPDEVINIGDEVDFHALSRFVRDPDGHSAGSEINAAIKAIKPLYAMFPKVKVCVSNHVNRPYDRAFEAGIPKSFMKDIGTILEAPKGWKWGEEWIIDGISYQHGHHLPGGKTGIQRVATEMAHSTVFGHIHAHAGIYYYANKSDLRFAFNVGCLIDVDAYAFVYGKKYHCKPIIGCGIVLKGVPQFIPMLLDKKGRWVGR